MNARTIRAGAAAVLVVDLLAVLIAGGLRLTHPDPAPTRSHVVDSQCVGGSVVNGVDDGSPAGLLALDTGAVC